MKQEDDKILPINEMCVFCKINIPSFGAFCESCSIKMQEKGKLELVVIIASLTSQLEFANLQVKLLSEIVKNGIHN